MDSSSKSKMRMPYFQVPNAVFDSDLGLGTYEKIILIYFYRCSNQGATAYPSLSTISFKTGMSKRKVSLVIESLVTKKIVSKESRSGKSNIYRLLHNIQGLHDLQWYNVHGLQGVQGSNERYAIVPLHDMQPIKNNTKKKKEKELKSESFDLSEEARLSNIAAIKRLKEQILNDKII